MGITATAVARQLATTRTTSAPHTQLATSTQLAASRTGNGRWRVVLPRQTLTLDEGATTTATASSDGKPRSWIMLLPEGSYREPRYGKLVIDQKLLTQLKQTFDERVRQIEIALDEDHDAGKATGWLEAVEIRAAAADGSTPAGLWGLVRWTPLGAADVRDELYRYFSIEYGPYKDIISGQKYPNVIWGGGLTNRPVMKQMPAVALSERSVSRRPWGQVKKSCLPRSCFLIPGAADDKSTWKLPIYEGAGPKDAAGHYTKRGALNLNAVRAALAAIGGARTGKPMTGVPSTVKARLERLLARYDRPATRASGRQTTTSKQPAQQHSEGSRTVPTSKRTQGHKQDRTRDDELLDEREFDEGNDDEGAGDEETFAYADDEDMADASYDEADGDGADDGDGEEGDGFDAGSDTHGQMTTEGHAHGKYAEHSHEGDGDHSEAPLKQMSGRRKKASEQANERRSNPHAGERAGDNVRALREQLETQSQQLAEMRFALYETEVGKTLDGWRSQTYQFKEGKTRDGKPVMRTGKIAMSKAFADSYRAFMLKEAIRLPQPVRARLNELIESALSTAVVDLAARGSAFDQESRRTLKASDRANGASDSDKLEQAAQRLLAEQGKTLSELSQAQVLALYERAAAEVEYR